MNLTEIILKVNATDEVDIDIVEVHEQYFRAAFSQGENIMHGVVGTPKFIAEFMVAQCANFVSKPLNEISWYDPCSGSGIFAQSIIEYYANELTVKSAEDLPKIHIAEISAKGMLSSLLIIKKCLVKLGICLNDYLKIERLKITLGDSLTLACEQSFLSSFEQVNADIVIGNPPYVKALRLDQKYKNKLKHLFPQTFDGAANLYFYFLTSGLLALNSKGILCYISPLNFISSPKASRLRRLIDNKFSIFKIIDLGEEKVFNNADTQTGIYFIGHSTINHDTSITYSKITPNSHRPDSAKLILQSTAEVKLIQDKSFWRLTTGNELFPFESERLKDTDISLYSGIRPSYKKAFVWTEDEIEHLHNDLIKTWFRPCLNAHEIVKWGGSRSESFLLFIPMNTKKIPIEILELLSDYEVELKKRSSKVDDYSWCQLRPCSYYEIFEKPRLIFPDISSHSRFSFTNSRFINLDGSLVIDTDNLALLAYLNSSLAWQYFTETCTSIGNPTAGGRLRLKKVHLEQLPIPVAILESTDLSRELNIATRNYLLYSEQQHDFAIMKSILSEICKQDVNL